MRHEFAFPNDCTCESDPQGGAPVLCPSCRALFNHDQDEIVERVLSDETSFRKLMDNFDKIFGAPKK